MRRNPMLQTQPHMIERYARPWRIVLMLTRAVLAAVFIYAGILKMLDLEAFSRSIATFELLPGRLINIVAITLPPLEILSGLLLLSTRWRHLGALAIILMNLLFVVALVAALARGIEVDCGCFGSRIPQPGDTVLALLRDLALLAAGVAVYGTSPRVVEVTDSLTAESAAVATSRI